MMDFKMLLIRQLRWPLAMLFLLFVTVLYAVTANLGDVTHAMPKEERETLKEEARDMFYHAYRAYMENAYPADELMPLTCCGRWRGTEPSRGDIDDTLGNFSLTLVDTLDTLVILGDLKEFEHAVKLVARDVSFDSDIVVSVFETNIRILGGLLSGHILAEYFQQRAGIMKWYRSELLDLARDVGYRLLPAFNTSTGIPHARINLRYGLKSPKLENSRETCTACAGTMILEMAALSRLTGETIFEEKAHRAMDTLWRMRHRSSDLMGTVLNVHSGDWVRRDSGVGAGIDSYYEYCLKAYILLGDERYLGRFNRHYSAVMKYISQGPMLLDVHMHRPHTNSRNFMDALLAFWPGLQVLKGDIKPAVETHEMLYQVMQRHKFIPEAFTTDFQVHWGQHPLRPEFLESTYFLYRATGDPYYLDVGRNVLRSLQKYARVPCGYAAVKDVRTGVHEDRMDSFVLAETFKYLYLLFADPSDLILDLDEFLFTTEAHLLPLSLARLSNLTVVDPLVRKRGVDDSDGIFPSKDSDHGIWDEDVENARSCPNTLHLFPESVRRPLRNMVDGICPKNSMRRKLRASEYQAGNQDHTRIINDMGITVITLPDGRVQLVHNMGSAPVGVPEITPVETADFHASVEQVGDQELIRITRKESTDPLPDTPKEKLSTREPKVQLTVSDELLSPSCKKVIEESEGKKETIYEVAARLWEAHYEDWKPRTSDGITYVPNILPNLVLCLSAMENLGLVTRKGKETKPYPPDSFISESSELLISVFSQISQMMEERNRMRVTTVDTDAIVKKAEDVLTPVEDECPEDGDTEEELKISDVLVEAVPAERCPVKEEDAVSEESRTRESDKIESDEKVVSRSDGVEIKESEPETHDEL
ncbi:hypothetical protein J437_LFUL002810 [Ladona fulva]|uniref:alpha-1,2-Mannosidase n=1 Tax=Ladona fulva TaxID=123851 RepID=A0A8K0NZT4_LADFU|nr:hypothetical protein J437_LFUL002810 [Ladona fulva]